MKKVLLSLVLIVGFGGYAFWSSRNSAPTEPAIIPAVTTSEPITTPEPVATPPVTTTGSTPTPPPKPVTTTPSPVPAPTPTPTPTPTPAPKGQYVDGTYTGEATGSIFGIVQVAAVVSGGKLSDVKFLQFPNDRENSIRISNESLPILKSEAIAAQSAKVDIVSGATQTSEAFSQSLSVALQAAKS